MTYPFPSTENIQVILRAPSDDERSKGHKSFIAFLDILGEFVPTKKALPVFLALFDGRRPPESQKAKTAEDMIVREGPSYGLEYYPDPFVSFVDRIHEELSSVGRKVVSILRWRYAQEGPPSPISTRGLFCAISKEDSWHSVPGRYSILNVTPPHSVLDSRQVEEDEVLALIESQGGEPVGHELLREAKELQHASPRSSVLVAVSAAEVAVKSVIVNKLPEAAWLVDSMQSPPIVNILIEYFPKLFDDREKFYEPTKKQGLVKTICDAVLIRDRMAHKGAAPPVKGKISENILSVELLLWICDYYCDYKWARSHIQRIQEDLKDRI